MPTPTSPSGRPPPCLPYCRPGKKKKGRRRKGEKEAEGIEVKMEMKGLITAAHGGFSPCFGFLLGFRSSVGSEIGGIELLIYAAFIGRLSAESVFIQVVPLRNATRVHLAIGEGK
uniref:Uncharacterized protein n=1 Tax=Oryza nivara TaxID=4536 RepID=A0A0E0G147_ORYNI